MANYDKLKVTELRELLQERNLAQTGNKPDLIKRLQENDAAKEAGNAGEAAPTAIEDEIDYEDDDVTPAAVSTTTAPVATPALATAAPETTSSDPVAATSTITATGTEDASNSAVDADITTATDTDATPAVPAEPAPAPASVFTQNMAPTDPKTEAEKRAARAAKFGVPPESLEAKKAARAAKFGLESDEVTKMLDSALPDKREKRKRGEEKEGTEPGAKRGTPGPEAAAGGARNGGNNRRRNGRGGGKGGGGEEQGQKKKNGAGGKQAAPAQNQDPEWKAKLEARAKRFAKEN